jgi:L-ascorbate metabolism protein UlaG (beta-lactamase superfamily)
MKIKWLGHSAFLITAQDGTRIITDPYKPGSFNGALAYKPIKEPADIVTISHEHDDHNYVIQIGGKPQVMRNVGTETIKNIKIEGVTTYHDTSRGRERGLNTVYVMDIDGLRVCHLGDLGHVPSAEETKQIGPIDILLLPVGGIFTVDAKAATDVMKVLKPKLVIPMHYKTADCGFPIAPVDDFLSAPSGKSGVKRLEVTEIEVDQSNLPEQREIWVLKYEL